MKTAIQIFLTQTRRGTKRLMLQLVLLCAVTAFFVVSLNLYSNSRQNLQAVENTYTTIATMEIYGYVNKAGELVHPGDESCVGRHWLSVEDYDLSPLLELDCVERIDLRTRVGAYVPGHIQVYYTDEHQPFGVPPGCYALYSTDNTVRFVLKGEEPMTLSLTGSDAQWLDFPIRVIETSNPLLQFPEVFSLQSFNLDEEERTLYADEIRRLNRSDATDSITLYPGVEYVLAGGGGSFWQRDPETGTYIWAANDGYGLISAGEMAMYQGLGLRANGFRFYVADYLSYAKHGITATDVALPGEPFPLHRYEDVKDDPVWAEYTQAGEYNSSSFAVTLTDDIALIPAWYQGAMFLNEGRMITDAEYKSGAKVCMVSADMAAYQGWQVGDKLDMHLYAYDTFRDQNSIDFITKDSLLYPPTYWKDCGGFFADDTYEIVGIFGRREFTDYGSSTPAVYFNPRDAIYIPANAAPNAPEGPIQPSLITIHLKNGGIGAFKQAVENMGLTDFRVGEYEIKFNCFDQGYSKIKPGLDEMNRNAVLLLALSGLLLLVTMVLTSFLFAQQHKHNAGILRMLGGSKKQTFTAILTCAAAVVAAGGMVGTVLGGMLTQSVDASTLVDSAASVKVALSTGANPILTILSGIGCIVLFLALTAIFTATFIHKEPRDLLPEYKG